MRLLLEHWTQNWITGVASDTGPTFQSKRIDLLLKAAPGTSHIGCLAGASPYMAMRELWSEANRRGVSVQEFHHRGGRYEDAFTAMMLLDGAKPSELPFEQPDKFEFILNLQAATHLGLIIPPSLAALVGRRRSASL